MKIPEPIGDERDTMNHPAMEESSPTRGQATISSMNRVLRFLGWSVGFAGLYSVSAACPFCGRQGCPVGLASSGIVGFLFALCLHVWHRLSTAFRKTDHND